MKRLIVCNTYFQLITSIWLKLSECKYDTVDLIISDQSIGADKVTNNLRFLELFRNVIFVENKEFCQKQTINPLLKIKRFNYIVFGMNTISIRDNKYDELLYYNPDLFTYGLFAKLYDSNPNIKCSRYEEGVLSYEDVIFLEKSRLKHANTIRHLLGKKSLEDMTEDFYCFYPEFYHGKLNNVTIPKISDVNELAKILASIFDIKKDSTYIKEKYIFFTSVYDFEGGAEIGETKLVQKITDIVGKENLIVKTHPRDNRDIFGSLGISTYKNSSIPWEAIQLNGDFSDKVFLTVNSGSVLGANLLIEKRPRVFFMHKCCNCSCNPAAISTTNTIDDLLKKIKIDGVGSISSVDEFKTIMSQR